MTPFLGNQGYVRVHVGADHPLADRNGKASIHHLVKASAGRDGRKLREAIRAGKLVHHADDDKANNSRGNLRLIERAKHTAMHNRKRGAK